MVVQKVESWPDKQNNGQFWRPCKNYWVFNVKTIKMYYKVNNIWHLNIWKQDNEAQEHCCSIVILFIYYLKVGWEKKYIYKLNSNHSNLI